MPEFIHTLQGFLNTDDSFITPQGNVNPWDFDYRYALNFIKNQTGREGQGENILGNTEISTVYDWDGTGFNVTASLPAGQNKCVFKFIDRGKLRIVYGIYNSLGSHGIYIYDLTDQKIKRYFQGSILNFSSKHITGLTVYDDLLFIANKENPQRCIDLSSIHKRTHSISEFHLSLAKYTPLAPPKVIPVLSSDKVETMKEAAFQFISSYRYKNGMRSRYSSISNMVYSYEGRLEYIEVDVSGIVYNSSSNSYYRHSDAEVYEEIDYIEIAVRNGENEPFRVFKRIDLSSVANYKPEFRNDGVYASIPIQETNTTFDSIPLKSGALAGIDNRIMLADNEEDFPHVEGVSITNVEYYYNSNLSPTVSTDFLTVTSSLFPSTAVEIPKLNSGNRQTFKTNGIYYMGVVFGDETGRRSNVYTFEQVFHINPSIIIYQAAIGFEFSSGFKPPEWATWYEIVRSNCVNYEFFINAPVNSLKYKKKETDGSYTNAPRSEAAYILLDISNWSGQTNSDAGGDDKNPLNNIFYEYQEGDYVRIFNLFGADDFFIQDFVDGSLVIKNIYKSASSYPTDGFPAFIEVYRPNNYSEETLFFYSMGEWYPVRNPKTASRDWTKKSWRYTNNTNIVKRTLGSFYWFDNYPIVRGDVHKLNKFFWIDYTAEHSNVSGVNQFNSMNPDVDNIAGPWIRGNGHVNVPYNDKAETKVLETQIRNSGKIVPESRINFLNRFEFDDQEVYPTQYGRIRMLQPASNSVQQNLSNILLALFETESISIYVNKTTLQDELGNVNLIKSDAVLGSWNTLAGSHGTLNPESVSQEGNRVYWWDAIKGTWVRYSRDGITPISDYKMRNFYATIGSLLIGKYRSAEEPEVVSGFDLFRDELITNIRHSSLPAKFPIENLTDPYNGYEKYKSCGFLEKPYNRWSTFYDYEQYECFAGLGNEFFSWQDGRLYKHRSGGEDQYNRFSETQYPSVVELICNPNYLDIKTFESIKEVSLHKWEIERILTNLRKYNEKSQQSYLRLSNFEEVEYTYSSDFKNDINSKKYPSNQTKAYYEGDHLKGNYLRVLMKLDSSVVHRTALFAVRIGYNESKNNRQNG